MKRRHSSTQLIRNKTIDMFFKPKNEINTNEIQLQQSKVVIFVDEDGKKKELIQLDGKERNEMQPKLNQERELSYEESIVFNWLEKEKHCFHHHKKYSKMSNKAVAMLYQLKIQSIKELAEFHQIEYCSYSVDEFIGKNWENSMSEEHMIVYEIDITTKNELVNVLENFEIFPQGIYVFNCLLLSILDYSSIMSSIGLFLPLKDGDQYLTDQIKSITRTDNLKIHKNHINNLLKTFASLPNCFFYILHCFSLVKKGICNFTKGIIN